MQTEWGNLGAVPKAIPGVVPRADHGGGGGCYLTYLLLLKMQL